MGIWEQSTTSCGGSFAPFGREQNIQFTTKAKITKTLSNIIALFGVQTGCDAEDVLLCA